MSNKAFTLIELLVVVLIIGILTAVALPKYQTAVNKSRYAKLMPLAKSIKDAEEEMLMATGNYTTHLDSLTVHVPGTIEDNKVTNGEQSTLEVISTDTHDYVKASQEGLSNTYVMYFVQSENFPGEIHCEAKKQDDRAAQLCKSYGPTQGPITATDASYDAYVLSGTGNGTGLNAGTSSGEEGGESGTIENPKGVQESGVACVKNKLGSNCERTVYNDGSYLEEWSGGEHAALYDEDGKQLFKVYNPASGVSQWMDYSGIVTDPVLNQEVNTYYEVQYNQDGSLRKVDYQANFNNYPYVAVSYSVYNGNVSLSQLRVIPDSSMQSIIYDSSGTRIGGDNSTYDQLVHDNINAYKVSNNPTKTATLSTYCAMSPSASFCQ